MPRFFQRLNLQTLTLLVALSALVSPIGWAQTSVQQEEKRVAESSRLVPAALGIRTDRKGNSWNVEQNGTIGRIGSTMVNSGLALMINDEKFVSFQPMMTADGSEFVLQGRPIESLPGLQVQRRIRLMEDAGGLRYAEMFYNGSTDPMSLNVSLATNFSGNYKTFLTDRGRTEPVILGETETGIVVLPGSSQSTKAYLFTLAGPDAGSKPTISAQNRYGLAFQYRLELAPGETAVIAHNVAQVVIPQNFDRRTLLKLFGPLSFDETAGFLDAEWSDRIANAAGSVGEENYSALAGSLSATLGIEPDTTDVLASGSETRLVGVATGDEILLSGDYGAATIPLETVAAIKGANGQPSQTPRVFLRDGQIFTAQLEAPGLSFEQTGGGSIELSPVTLDRLVMAKSEADGKWSNDDVALIETYSGDRLKIRRDAKLTLSGITPWGTLPVSFNDLVWIGPASQQSLGYRVELADGTDCFALFPDEEIGLTLSGIGDYVLKTSRLKSVFTPLSKGQSRFDAPGFTDSLVHLTGDQSIAGTIGNTTLPVVGSGGLIETASGEIRRIERVAGGATAAGGFPIDAPTFRIERWDGGVINGYIQLDLLSLNVRGRNWEIPIQDIESVETASPDLTEDVLGSIKALVTQLGASEWSTREKATIELGAFGYLARSTLQRELSTAKDPEITRRIERVLSELN